MSFNFDYSRVEDEKRRKAHDLYLLRLYNRCQTLPLATLGGEETADAELTLQKVYISLDTTDQVEMSEEEIKTSHRRARFGLENPSDKMRPVTALEKARRHPRLVILGKPGSGKSTFLKELLSRQISVPQGEGQPEFPSLLPVYLQLRELAARLAGLELAKCSEEKARSLLIGAVLESVRESARQLQAEDYAEELAGIVKSGKVMLGLDGLDEVPHDLRECTRRAVAVVMEELRPQRVLITCRVRSYTGEAVLSGIETALLAPFDNEKIEQFSQAWYNGQCNLGRVTPDQRDAKANNLAHAARGSDLSELAANPMMLTSMAIIHQKEIGLPSQRVVLYKLVVEVLLRRWQERKAGEELSPNPELSAFLKDEMRLRPAIEQLAYEAHSAGSRAKGAADLTRNRALEILEANEHLGEPGLAGQFLDYVDQRAGILVGQGGEPGKPVSYAFPHRTFLEYLAGCHLVRSPCSAWRAYYPHAADNSDWADATHLRAEELLYNRCNAEGVLDLAYGLRPDAFPENEQDQRVLLWASTYAALVGKEKVEADRETRKGGKAYLKKIRPLLVQLLAGCLPPPERVQAGRALAKLGDPRCDLTTLEEMQLCYTPAGPFWMGSQKNEKESKKNEIPAHKIDLPAFWIGIFPVTNAQYNLFVSEEGYQQERFWLEARRAGYWSPEGFKGRFDFTPRLAPFQLGEPYNLPNHPAMGMSWYETLAFIHWLEDRWREAGFLHAGWRVRLPSEAEWEKAARGGLEILQQPVVASPQGGGPHDPSFVLQENPLPRRPFPWGKDFDPSCANADESRVGSSSTPGCFSDGASPYGVQDLSGNVCEWTRSRYADYPYNQETETDEPAKDARMVLRGGSFLDSSWDCRCAVRNGHTPDDWFSSFRVVLSPSS